MIIYIYIYLFIYVFIYLCILISKHRMYEYSIWCFSVVDIINHEFMMIYIFTQSPGPDIT